MKYAFWTKIDFFQTFLGKTKENWITYIHFSIKCLIDSKLLKALSVLDKKENPGTNSGIFN